MTTRCWRTNKFCFSDHVAARKEANILAYKNKQRGEEQWRVDVYLCTHCETYHVGRGPQGGETDTALQRF